MNIPQFIKKYIIYKNRIELKFLCRKYINFFYLVNNIRNNLINFLKRYFY